MRKDPLVGRPQATPPAADGAKLGGGLEGGRLLDFSGRQSRGWGRERVPPRHDCITIICILCGPIQVRISSINLTYINFTGIFEMSVPRSREACSALGTIARPSVYPAERRLGAHFNLPTNDPHVQDVWRNLAPWVSPDPDLAIRAGDRSR